MGSISFVFLSLVSRREASGFLTGFHVFRKVLMGTICFHFISFVLEPRICLVSEPDLSMAM